jgi:hypothetical protein
MSIEQINLKRSISIYDELTKGRIINRHIYSSTNHALIDNTLFQELRENTELYKNQYLMSGHELVDEGEYFYLILRKLEGNNAQPVKTKVYSAVIVLVRCVTHLQARLFDSLKNVNYGVDINEFESLTLPEDYQLVLEKAKLGTLIKAIEYLNDKNILLKTNRNKYILSNAGSAIIDEIIELHSGDPINRPEVSV